MKHIKITEYIEKELPEQHAEYEGVKRIMEKNKEVFDEITYTLCIYDYMDWLKTVLERSHALYECALEDNDGTEYESFYRRSLWLLYGNVVEECYNSFCECFWPVLYGPEADAKGRQVMHDLKVDKTLFSDWLGDVLSQHRKGCDVR